MKVKAGLEIDSMPCDDKNSQKFQNFNLDKEYGSEIASYTGRYQDIVPGTLVYDILVKSARLLLPPGTPFELRGSLPSQGRLKTIGWYYCPPRIRQRKNTELKKNSILIAKCIA